MIIIFLIIMQKKMFTYITLILLCSSTGALMNKFQNRRNKYFIYLTYISFIMLFIISALRYEVGRDYTDTYVMSYERILAGVKNVRMDIGVKLIYKLMAIFQADPQWIFVITSFLINWLACKSIATQSPDCRISFWIYLCGTFYFFSMNGVRQAVAMMFFYYSFRYIKERNLKMYLILNGIGFLFHASAILFFPLYFLLNRSYKFKDKLMVICITLLSSRFFVPFIMAILMKTHYAMYLTNGAYKIQESLNFSMYLNIVLFILYELAMKKRDLVDEQGAIYSNIHFCGLIVSLLATSLPLMIRVFMSFRYIEFLSVPYLMSIQSKRRYRQIIVVGVMALYFAYFVWGVLIQNGNTVLPYKTIFSKIWGW